MWNDLFVKIFCVVNASFLLLLFTFPLSPSLNRFDHMYRWVSFFFYCEALSIDRVWCLFNIFIALSFLLLLLTFLPLSICRRSIVVHLIWKSIPTDHRFYTNHSRTFLPTRFRCKRCQRKEEKKRRNFKTTWKKTLLNANDEWRWFVIEINEARLAHNHTHFQFRCGTQRPHI